MSISEDKIEKSLSVRTLERERTDGQTTHSYKETPSSLLIIIYNSYEDIFLIFYKISSRHHKVVKSQVNFKVTKRIPIQSIVNSLDTIRMHYLVDFNR
jgi:hypothetical protein